MNCQVHVPCAREHTCTILCTYHLHSWTWSWHLSVLKKCQDCHRPAAVVASLSHRNGSLAPSYHQACQANHTVNYYAWIFVQVMIGMHSEGLVFCIGPPKFGVEDGNDITHDRAVSLLRKELPHGITWLILLVLQECTVLPLWNNRDDSLLTSTLRALDCNNSVILRIFAIPSICGSEWIKT